MKPGEHVLGFSKATTAHEDIPSLTLIFEESNVSTHDYKGEARQIAEYMHMCLPTATIIHLAEYLTEQVKELK